MLSPRLLPQLLFLSVFPFAPTFAEEPRELIRPVFEAGKTYRFLVRTAVQMAPLGEMPRQIEMTQQARFDVDPGKRNETAVSLRGLTERLTVSIQSGTKNLQYDSLGSSNEESAIGRHFESTVNRFVTVELDESMKVLSHEEGGKSGGATPLPGLPRFGPEELVQLIHLLPQGYPRDPVQVGDEWVLRGDRRVGELGELGFEISYRLTGPVEFEGRSCLAIDFRGQMTGDVGSADSRHIDFQGSRIAGRMLFDPEAGMTRQAEHFVSMVVNTPGETTGETRPVPMQQKMTVELMQVVDR